MGCPAWTRALQSGIRSAGTSRRRSEKHRRASRPEFQCRAAKPKFRAWILPVISFIQRTIEIMNHHELHCRQAEVKLRANLSGEQKWRLMACMHKCNAKHINEIGSENRRNSIKIAAFPEYWPFQVRNPRMIHSLFAFLGQLNLPKPSFTHREWALLQRRPEGQKVGRSHTGIGHAPFAHRPAHFAEHRPSIERRVLGLRFGFGRAIGPLGLGIEDHRVGIAADHQRATAL